jgi:hypothetical protein
MIDLEYTSCLLKFAALAAPNNPRRTRNMADPPTDPDSGEATGIGRDREPGVRTPRWVKVFGLIALVVVVLFVVVMLVGGGDHGPGRHSGGGSVTPAAYTEPPPRFEHDDQQS